MVNVVVHVEGSWTWIQSMNPIQARQFSDVRPRKAEHTTAAGSFNKYHVQSRRPRSLLNPCKSEQGDDVHNHELRSVSLNAIRSVCEVYHGTLDTFE